MPPAYIQRSLLALALTSSLDSPLPDHKIPANCQGVPASRCTNQLAEFHIVPTFDGSKLDDLCFCLPIMANNLHLLLAAASRSFEDLLAP